MQYEFCAIRKYRTKRQKKANMQTVCCLLIVGLTTVFGAPAQTDRSGKPSTIAFSVGLSNIVFMSYSDTVVYDKVFSNFGDGYDELSGEFTAPVSGVYCFHAHGYNSNKDKAMWLELIKNYNPLVSVSGYDSHSTAGNTVILSLQKGDTVAVRARPGQEFTLFGKGDQIYTTFSGYRIGEIPYADPGIGR